MSINFPATAVIYPGSYEEAEVLREFLDEHGFKIEGTRKFTEEELKDLWRHGDSMCFDIETGRRSVSSATVSYYREEFEEDYPELMPDDESFFLCSVNDFIVMCGGKDRFPDFEGVDRDEIVSFLLS